MADRARRPLVLLSVLLLLVLVVGVSIFLGSNGMSPARVWHLLLEPDGSTDADVIRGQRLPRTLLAVAVGAALGLAGALMQAVTRNPLADPGILGVNAGASLLVVLAVAVAGTSSIWFYVWFAFAGAAAASVGVYVLAGTGRQAGSPERLALAGVAVSAALMSVTQLVVLADQEVLNEFRFWVAGSLEGRGWAVLVAVTPFLVLGAAVGLAVGPALGAMALGDQAAQGLGVRVVRTRTLAILAVTLLCGAATAAVGPIGFVGLAVPLLARTFLGHDQRWVSLGSMVLGAVALLLADALGRVVIAPQEIQGGIVAAIVGGPVFVAIARRRRVPAL